MGQGDAPVALTRRQEIFKFFQFVGFSISAGVIQVALYTLLAEVLHLSYWAAYLPALVASVLWNFTVNRRFTFKSVNNIPVAMLKVTAYYLVFTPLSTWWGNALTQGKSDDLRGYVVLVGTMIVNLLTEFCVQRFWVYRVSINTSEAGKREQERVKAG